MLDDRDYMRQPYEERTPRTVLRSFWQAVVAQFRWLFRFCWPQKSTPIVPHEADGEISDDEFVQTEVDPILEKISARGIQSLTKRERDVLENARAKMAKR